MRYNITKEAMRFSRGRRRRSIWLRILSVMCCLVVFVTTYMLILPAVTLEDDAPVYCGLTEHVHTGDCYEKVLVCGLEEGDPEDTSEESAEDASSDESAEDASEESAEDTSSDESAEGASEESAEDASSDESTEGASEESAEDTSSDESAEDASEESAEETSSDGSSDDGEVRGHVHTADCYELVLTCGMEEHTHSASCYEKPEDYGVNTVSDTDTAVALVCYASSDSSGSSVYGSAMLNTKVETGDQAGNIKGQNINWHLVDGTYTVYDSEPSSLALWTVYSDENCTIPVTSVTEDMTVYITTQIDGETYYMKINQSTTDSSRPGAQNYGGVSLTTDRTSVFLQVKTTEAKGNDMASHGADGKIYENWFNICESKERKGTSGAEGYACAFMQSDTSSGEPSFGTFGGAPQAKAMFQLMTVETPPGSGEVGIYSSKNYGCILNTIGSTNGTTVINMTDVTYDYKDNVEYFENGIWDIIIENSETMQSVASTVELWTLYDENRNKVDGISASGTYYITTTVDSEEKYLACEETNGTYLYKPALSSIESEVYIELQSDYKCKISLGNNKDYSGKGNAADLLGVYSTTGKDGIKNGALCYENNSDFEFVHVVTEMEEKEPVVYNTVQTVNPIGTTINLFDYWTTERWPEGGDYGEGGDSNGGDNPYTEDNFQGNKGINENRTLKFTYPPTLTTAWGKNYNNEGTENRGGTNGLNRSNSDGGYGGIVRNTIGSDGFPELTDLKVSWNHSKDEEDSYSLAYLFDPNYESDYKLSFSKVSGFLQQDGEGYYYYNCKENFAEFDEETNTFTVYEDPGTYQNKGKENEVLGGFFPFNKFAEVEEEQVDSSSLNHYFGLTLTDRFLFDNDGYMDSSKERAMTFEFSGDDDVWIFLDGVLVADLGGIHGELGVKIDFASGSITYTKSGIELTGDSVLKPTTLYAQFEAAEMTDTVKWNGDKTTFENNSYHTLNFYYLERGNSASNLYLKYNLTSVNPTSLYKVDQYGDVLAGAGFAVYATDENYDYYPDGNSGTAVNLSECDSYTVSEENGVITAEKGDGKYTITPRYAGKSNSDGEMIFENDSGGAYAASELRSMFGEHFVLREFKVPSGYRYVAEEIEFYWDGDYLFCDNAYESGAFSRVDAIVTASETLYYADDVGENGVYSGDTVDYYSYTDAAKGTLFAVVLKKNGVEGDVEYWYPVTGNSNEGYDVWDETAGIENVIEAAKSYGTDHVFAVGDSGKMVLDVTDLPGEIDEYYTYIQQRMGDDYNHTNCLERSEYYIAYYYSTADSLDGANDKNTNRVVSRDGVITNYSGFDYDIGAEILVTNMENRLYLYKLDSENHYIENAAFALYSVGEETDSDGKTELYYLADDDTKIYLDADTDGDNKGTAKVGENSATYTISMSESDMDQKDENTGLITADGAGVITVALDSDPDTTYTISPVKNAKGASQVAYTHLKCGYGYNADGYTGHFTLLEQGSYVVREIYAPKGFILNTTEVRVLITQNATYADAGTDSDGVSVGKGAGYLASSLHAVASEGQIDRTLSWIYAVLEKTGVSSFENLYKMDSNHSVEGDSSWQYGVSAGDSMTSSSETTTELKKAIITYLEYDVEHENAIFDYTTNADYTASGTNSDTGKTWDRTKTGDGTGNRRLWTETGWSYLAIYQDYDYGKSAVSGNVDYHDLSSESIPTFGEDGEISNLFSRSTYIAVQDTRYVDLTVEKVSGNGSSQNLTGAEFYLYREVTKEYYTYTESNESSGGVTGWTADELEATILSTTKGKNSDDDSSDGTSSDDGTYTNLKIYALTPGTYYLVEKSAPSGYHVLYEPITIEVFENGEVQITYRGKTYKNGDAGTDVWKVAGTSAEYESETDSSCWSYQWTITVPNFTGEILPETGGYGVYVLYGLGSLLVLLAVGVAVLERRGCGE